MEPIKPLNKIEEKQVSDQIQSHEIELQPKEIPLNVNRIKNSVSDELGQSKNMGSRSILLLTILVMFLIAIASWFIFRSTNGLREQEMVMQKNKDKETISNMYLDSKQIDPEIVQLSAEIDAALNFDNEADLKSIDSEF